MRNVLKAFAFAILFATPAATANAQVSFGITIGEPPSPRAYRVPPRPGPDYIWVEGYHYPQNGKYRWHDGYWTRPPYPGAYWVEPYYYRGQYYAGRWENGPRYLNHDHRWDKNKDRDWNHDRDHDRDDQHR
jgi:WXXGXW repeat (2 copies)